MRNEVKEQKPKVGLVKKSALAVAIASVPAAMLQDGPPPTGRVCDLKAGERAYVNSDAIRTRLGFLGTPTTRRLLITAPVWSEPSMIFGCGGEAFNAFRDEPHYCYEVVAEGGDNPSYRVNGRLIPKVPDDGNAGNVTEECS